MAITEARKYYYGILKPKVALPYFDRVLKIDPDNKEVLNQKFKMLVVDGQYDVSYDLLTRIEIDYPEIAFSIKELTDFYIDNEEYERAKYCLNLILNQGLDYKILKQLKFVWDKSNDRKSQKECSYYMDWINLIKFKHDENTCPCCGNKLIPIKYGVIMANDSGFKTGKYYASENIKHEKYRATDYCNIVKRKYIMDFVEWNLWKIIFSYHGTLNKF